VSASPKAGETRAGSSPQCKAAPARRAQQCCATRPAREVAQIGSVIGRGFSYNLLKAVAAMEDAPLEAALEKLSDADIVLVEGVLPESNYRFKHALIQDAAYENLLKSRCQTLHRRIAETLRDGFAEKAAAEPEVLAHHFTQAGATDAAIEWWGKAGDQALRRSAFQEAISHLGKAIEMADKAGDRAPRPATAQAAGAERLRLQTAYGSALLHGRGMQSPETHKAFSRAQELAAGPDDLSQRFSIQYALWAGHFVRGELAPLREIAELVLREVETRPDSPEAVVGFRLNGATEWFAGNFTAARAFLERARAVFDPQRHSDPAYRFAQDIGVSVAVYLALVLWMLGEVDQARAAAEEGVARATRSGHVSTIGYAHFHLAVFEMLRRSASASASHIEALVNVSRTHEMEMWTAYGQCLAPWLRRGVDGPDAVLAEMRNGIATCREQSIGNYAPFLTTALAEAEAQAGQIEQALAPSTASSAIASEVVNAGSPRKHTASAGRFCSSVIPRILPRLRKQSLPPSPLRNSRRRGASNCARRCRWPSFINRPAALPTHTLCSHRCLRAFRRRRNSRKSARHKRCSPRCRHKPIIGCGNLPNWHNAGSRGCVCAKSAIHHIADLRYLLQTSRAAVRRVSPSGPHGFARRALTGFTVVSG
jgi:hypothetical protein